MHAAKRSGTSVSALFDGLRRDVDHALGQILPSAEEEPREVHAAMRYAVLSGGHRWRPILLLQTGRMYGADLERLMSAAVGVEFGHCASIILDDMSCMDDAPMRRGKQACHAVYGDATTLLASLKLTMLALDHFASYGSDMGLDALARRTICEMIDGQNRDLRSDVSVAGNGAQQQELLRQIQGRKTGAMFRLAVLGGARIGEAPPGDLAILSRFADALALAYQAFDDVRDADGTAEGEGKSAHRDGNKVTAVSVFGLDGGRRRGVRLWRHACEELARLPGEVRPLQDTAGLICGVK